MICLHAIDVIKGFCLDHSLRQAKHLLSSFVRGVLPSMEPSDLTCRICFEEATANLPLVSPCGCTGATCVTFRPSGAAEQLVCLSYHRYLFQGLRSMSTYTASDVGKKTCVAFHHFNLGRCQVCSITYAHACLPDAWQLMHRCSILMHASDML